LLKLHTALGRLEVLLDRGKFRVDIRIRWQCNERIQSHADWYGAVATSRDSPEPLFVLLYLCSNSLSCEASDPARADDHSVKVPTVIGSDDVTGEQVLTDVRRIKHGDIRK
jgi:hypothetical protein